MRAFSCPRCAALVFFENTACLRCGQALGFAPEAGALVSLDAGYWRCANQVLGGCNWLVSRDDPAQLCASCRLTRTRPNDADHEALDAFAAAEEAKRRLVFQLRELGLPLVSYRDDPEQGLAFDLLSSHGEQVLTGHDAGVITIDLAESDEAHRAQVRREMGEPYRTMLGHLRHEVGHYYWMVLVERAGHLPAFRARFGDERADYDQALAHHYETGPPADWLERHVSAYATMHPWEDWAETFAHYLHIRDTLQTAASYGLRVPASGGGMRRRHGDIECQGFYALLADWLPLTYALNAVNRSMGRDDLYPFVLSPAVITKLAFVHGLVAPEADLALES